MNPIISLLRKQAAQLLIIACLTVLTGVAIASTWRGALVNSLQSDSVGKGHVLRKKLQISKKNQPVPLSILFNGVQAADYINVRPTEKSQLEVIAGTVMAADISKARPGEPLPDSAVEISESGLTFNRPPSTEGTLFLDVQVPSGQQINVAFDGITILSASLREPVSFRGKQLGAGSANAAEAVAQTLLPQGIVKDQRAVPPLKDGKLFVPFSQLRLAKKVAISKGALVAAMLEIDENGRVVNVKSLTGSMPAEIEGNLKKLEFTPFQQDGRAVSVVTVLGPTNQ